MLRYLCLINLDVYLFVMTILSRKFVISFAILLIALLGELLIWNRVVMLSIFLVILAYIKHKMYPIKKELLWFMFISLGGALMEIILVNFGHGWSYAHPDFLGIPFWIPIFWGLVGTTVVVMYEGLVHKS